MDICSHVCKHEWLAGGQVCRNDSCPQGEADQGGAAHKGVQLVGRQLATAACVHIQSVSSLHQHEVTGAPPPWPLLHCQPCAVGCSLTHLLACWLSNTRRLCLSACLSVCAVSATGVPSPSSNSSGGSSSSDEGGGGSGPPPPGPYDPQAAAAEAHLAATEAAFGSLLSSVADGSRQRYSLAGLGFGLPMSRLYARYFGAWWRMCACVCAVVWRVLLWCGVRLRGLELKVTVANTC